jgi:hypothetical protein
MALKCYAAQEQAATVVNSLSAGLPVREIQVPFGRHKFRGLGVLRAARCIYPLRSTKTSEFVSCISRLAALELLSLNMV